MVGRKILVGPHLGVPERILVGEFEMASRWDNQKYFGWKTGKVK